MKERQLDYEVQLLRGNLEAKEKEKEEDKAEEEAKLQERKKANDELRSLLAIQVIWIVGLWE